MRVSELLTDVFDRGLREGEKKLSRRDRELFLIWDFVIEFEMGGLSGYLYNRVAKRGRLAATARALTKYEVKPLARIFGELARRFATFSSDSSETWEDACRAHLSDARMKLLEEQLEAAQEAGFGVEKSKLAKLVATDESTKSTRTATKKKKARG